MAYTYLHFDYYNKRALWIIFLPSLSSNLLMEILTL